VLAGEKTRIGTGQGGQPQLTNLRFLADNYLQPTSVVLLLLWDRTDVCCGLFRRSVTGKDTPVRFWIGL